MADDDSNARYRNYYLRELATSEYGSQNEYAHDKICAMIDTLESQVNGMERNVNDVYGIVKDVNMSARQRYGQYSNVIKTMEWLYQGEKLSDDIFALRNRIYRLKQECNGNTTGI